MQINKKLFFGVSIILLLMFLAFSPSVLFPEIKAQSPEKLFSLAETPSAKSGNEKNSIASVRESEITFQTELLGPENSESLSFPLFDGKTYQAFRNKSEGLEIRGQDDYTWRGKIIEGKFSGDVTLTFKKGFVAGLIYSPNAVYEIIAKGDKHFLVELDHKLFPECGGEEKSVGSAKNQTENAGAASDSGDRIDVLVVYTTATKNARGGDAQAQTLAQQAIDATNSSYINSKIRQRVRLIHSQEYVFTETSTGSDLPALRTSAEIIDLRNTHNADLVAMLGEYSGSCGRGYLMGGAGGNQNNGFSITISGCAVGNLSFAHELGHNMGSAHNPENGSGATYSYGYGHYVNGSYRTVMSYSNPCTAGCTRRQYFSNPAIVFNDVPTGIFDQRENARSIDNTADVIANYRYSGSSLTLNNYNAGEFIPRMISRTVNWSSDNLGGNVKIEISRNESTDWQTLVASTPNDGSETINVYGRVTKNARLRITSLTDPNVSDSSTKNIFIR